MHVFTQTRLRDFAKRYPAADVPLRAWETLMRAKKYKSSHEVKRDFSLVDFLGDGKAVFDIGGNKYRLVVKFLYKAGQVLVRHVLTHEEYDRRTKGGTL